MSKIHFGTGGWRAIIGDDFTKANVQRMSYALARKMKDEKVEGRGFCIGFDRRFLSRQSAMWAAEVMAAEGITCSIITREAPNSPDYVYREKLWYGIWHGGNGQP